MKTTEQTIKLTPIGIETQIEDCIFGKSRKQETIISDKIKLVSENCDKIKMINGSKVFNTIVDGENIRYNLRNRTDGDHKYYYPIQYANIEF